MSTDLSKIKVEIKEWQRAYRRAYGRDPGKEELRKNPEMAAKYKIWQDSLKSDNQNMTAKSSTRQSSKDDTTAVTPKKSSKMLVPKNMPLQSTSTGPATPFSARKKSAARLHKSPASPASDQPKLNSTAKERNTIPALVLSASKPRTESTQSSRVIPFGSASSSRYHPFPRNLLDSDDDDDPFAAPGPMTPTRSRRFSQLDSPSKSVRRRQASSGVSTPSSVAKSRPTNFGLSPTRPTYSSEAGLPMLTPRTKARKRMRGEEVPATPGDKRRKLVPVVSTDKTTALFGEPSSRRAKRLTPEINSDDDDEEIIDSPRKKSTLGVNGRIFTNMFDDASSVAASTKDGISSLSETFNDGFLTGNLDEMSLRSTPPPPTSESGDSYAQELVDDDSQDDEPALDIKSRAKPLFPVAPGRWTQDTWEAPVPGTDLSHLRKGLAKAGTTVNGKGKATKQAKQSSQPGGEDDSKKAKENPTVSNPFELLPPMPGEETSQPKKKYENGESKAKAKGKESLATLKKRAKEAAEAVEGEDQSDSDAVAEVDEIAWRPHGPLRATSSALVYPSISNSQTTAHDSDSEEHDPTASLPSELRKLLSIKSIRQEEAKADILARDVLTGRSMRSGEVWGVGECDYDKANSDNDFDDWDSEPEGWTGGVEM